jgi:predicted TIM-barrel enzyme
MIPERRQWQRREIVARLRETIDRNEPVLAAGASAGIIAKCAEMAGADLLVVYSTGRSRLMGLPTTPIGDSNTETLAMFEEIANVTRQTPVIGGAEAVDPRYLALQRLVGRFRSAGYDGLINFPTIANLPDRRRIRDDVGLGFSREVELVELASAQDYFTMVYAYTPDDARAFASAGADVVVAHAGWTTGGLAGANESARTLTEAADLVSKVLDAALETNPAVIPLAHGGPFARPEDTGQLYELTPAVGFVGASSIERIPIENAVTAAVKEFKSVPVPVR